jgi:hypothetical protein
MWYPRMADIPGIAFHGSPDVDRSRLPEARVRPHAGRGYLSWPSPDGSTSSSSPVHRLAFGAAAPKDEPGLIRKTWEGLELPGSPSDYHFLLQGTVTELWKRRRRWPQGLSAAERFCHLDLILIEAAPEAVMLDKSDPDRGFVRITTLEVLVDLLEREGAVREALAVSQRARRFGERYWSEELEAKVAALDEELR